MVRRTKRLRRREEKRSICTHATAPGVSVVHMARCHAMSSNIIFEWLRDPRYAPEPEAEGEPGAADAAGFLPVEIVDRLGSEDTSSDPRLRAWHDRDRHRRRPPAADQRRL